jgi:hypothetical protein
MMNWIKKFLGKEEVLWASIDQWNPKYSVKVIRLKPYVGELTVSYENKVFFKQNVNIAYNAEFGVDYYNLESWAMLAGDATQAHEKIHQ